MLGRGLEQSREPFPLTPHLLPLSFRCTRSRMVHAAQQCPSSSPKSGEKSPSRAERDPAVAPSGCLKTQGAARRATGPGSGTLPCCFIEERWYQGASPCLLQLGGDAQPLSSLVELGASIGVSSQGT